MAPEKEEITTMILYVDLKCPCCYKKVRKLLCKFPQIRDQVFDVDKNKVTITVVCCDPERFRDKLCCKGGRAIQSIEIVENKPPPPKPTPAPAPAPAPAPKPKAPAVDEVPKDPPPKQLEKKPSGKPKPAVVPVPEKPKPDPPKPADPPKPVDPPKPTPTPPPVVVPQPQPQPQPVKMPDPIPQPQPQPQPQPEPVKMPDPTPMPMPMPMDGYHPHQPFCPPVSVCCQECYEGRDGGPCHYGYGRPVPPPPCYDYYGYQYPPNRPCYVSRCDYFSEDNPQGCSIM